VRHRPPAPARSFEGRAVEGVSPVAVMRVCRSRSDARVARGCYRHHCL
jgi:hypothetical protein